nr:SDR family NAD(P)-dependent oxidoreductase [Rosenbergiella epipactidis]
MAKLHGKIAVITGAGRGIGRATAKLFAAEGAKVAVLSLTPANIDAVVAERTGSSSQQIEWYECRYWFGYPLYTRSFSTAYSID